MSDAPSDDPDRPDGLDAARLHLAVAAGLRRCREAVGLTQREVAIRAGIVSTTVVRFEDGDYRGHTLATLRRLAAATGHRVELRFVPEGEGSR